MTIVRVGVAPWPHMNPQCFPSIETGCDAGVELDILHTIMSMSKLEIKLVITDEPACGRTPTDQGSEDGWTGLYKMLHDDEIDMTGNLCNGNKLSQVDQNFSATSWPVWQYQEQYVIQTPKPHPMSFAPFIPFSLSVWIAFALTCLAYLGFVVLYSYLRYGSVKTIATTIYFAAIDLSDVCCGFVTQIPLRLIWPLWFLLFTFVFMFYNTSILSAVLYPFPVWRPFARLGELAEAVASGKYQFLTHRNSSPIPSGCSSRKCEQQFVEASRAHGFRNVPSGSGLEMLTIIAEQDQQTETKLVLVDGTPFISMYLREFVHDRQRLWVIDETESYVKWSAYIWRKNFTFADEFNNYLITTGDYRFQVLSRYVRSSGSQPHTGDRILEASRQQAIGLHRFEILFLLHLGGMGAAVMVFLIEVAHARYRNASYTL